MNYVYWIYDETCKDILIDGYVGVSYEPENRFKTHLRKNSKIHEKCNMIIIMEGSREECFKKEKKLRPIAGIGWNSAAGGSHGWQVGFHHSAKSKNKMKLAWSEIRRKTASKFKSKQNKLLKGQKRPKQSAAVCGSKNGMYGKTHTSEAKQKISDAHRGRTPTNKQELYCIHCHNRVSESVLIKYHGPGKKNCLVK